MQEKVQMFDTIAEEYYTFTPLLPEKYINLIGKTFNIKSNDTIIDLGCGSGDLPLALTKFTHSIEGIDISKKMIEMAKAKDESKQVIWHHKSVDDFDFGVNKYNLIIAFESFHLFSNPQEIIKRCAKALKPGGVLCIGWRMYEWDIPLKDVIKETFDKYGIDRGEWGLWTCPQFLEDLKSAKTNLKSPQKKEISIKTSAPLDIIANYVLNVSRSAHINKEQKEELKSALVKSFLKIYPKRKSNGFTTYSLVYSQKPLL